jgi:hypothetical protein
MAGMSYRKFEIFTDKRIQTNNVTILHCFMISYLTMETHGFIATSAQSISSMQWTVLHSGMCQQFRLLFNNLGSVKFTFPYKFDLIPCSRYLLDSFHRSFKTLCHSVTAHCIKITERLACTTVKKTTKKLEDSFCFCTIVVHTEIRQFG